VTVLACQATPDMSAVAGDCDDGDPQVFPGADEYCNLQDDDCDGDVDEGDAVDGIEWYADDDRDGYGAPGSGIFACEAPIGTVANETDCDDNYADIFPGAEERCDARDNDCDGAIEADGDGVCRLWVYNIDADTWTREDLSGMHAPSGDIEAALTFVDLGEIWVLTATTYHVLAIDALTWTSHGTRDARFPHLSGVQVRGGWVNPATASSSDVYMTSDHTAWVFTVSTSGPTRGTVSYLASYAYSSLDDWRVTSAPRPEEVSAQWYDFDRTLHGAREMPESICGAGGTDMGYFIGMFSGSDVHFYETGWCWAFTTPFTATLFDPMGHPDAPPARVASGAGQTHAQLYLFGN